MDKNFTDISEDNKKIDYSLFSVRAQNVLKNLEIDTSDKLLFLDSESLLHSKNCGVKTAQEILHNRKAIINYSENKISFLDFLSYIDSELKDLIHDIGVTDYNGLFSFCAPDCVAAAALPKQTYKNLFITINNIISNPNRYDFSFDDLSIKNKLLFTPIFSVADHAAAYIPKILEIVPGHVFDVIRMRLSTRALKVLELLDINSLEGLLGLHDKKIRSIQHIGTNTIRDIKCSMLNVIEDEGNIGTTSEIFTDYNDAVDYFKSYPKLSDRMLDVILFRFGYYDNSCLTLEECGDMFNLTRERIRQLESKAIALIKTDELFINKLEGIIGEHLANIYGIDDASAVVDKVSEHFSFIKNTPELFVINLILTVTNYKYNKTYNIIFDNNHICYDCNKLKLFFEAIYLKRSDFNLQQLQSEFRNFCTNNCGDDYYSLPSEALFKFYININKILKGKLKYINGELKSSFSMAIETGSLNKAFEEVLIKEQRPMHAKEVLETLKQYREDLSLSENRAVTLLSNNTSTILWGPGTYIHKSAVTIDKDFLNQVRLWILAELALHSIPFITSYRCFSRFETECLDCGIINDYALYSSLRLCDFNDLILPTYPQIYFNSKDHERVSNVTALEDYILENNGAVDSEEFKDYALNKLGIKDFQYSHFFIDNNDFINDKNNKIIYLDGLEYNYEAFDKVVDYTEQQLIEFPNLSIEKVFDDKKVTCKLGGIHSPGVLFGLLKKTEHNVIKCGMYPTIFKHDDIKPPKSSINSVVEYIKEKEDICSNQELYNLISSRGYKESVFHNAIYGNYGIVVYSKACYVHEDVLDFSDDDVALISELIDTSFDSAYKMNKFFILSDDFIHSYSTELPDIKNDIPWTPFALSYVLRKTEYKFIGNNKHVICRNFHNTGIDYFIFKYLNTYCNGYEKIGILETLLKKDRIIKKYLNRSIVSNSQYIDLINGEVISRELEDDERP